MQHKWKLQIARVRCQNFVRLDFLGCVFHVNYWQLISWFFVQFGVKRHLQFCCLWKNLLVLINAKLRSKSQIILATWLALRSTSYTWLAFFFRIFSYFFFSFLKANLPLNQKYIDTKKLHILGTELRGFKLKQIYWSTWKSNFVWK